MMESRRGDSATGQPAVIGYRQEARACHQCQGGVLRGRLGPVTGIALQDVTHRIRIAEQQGRRTRHREGDQVAIPAMGLFEETKRIGADRTEPAGKVPQARAWQPQRVGAHRTRGTRGAWKPQR